MQLVSTEVDGVPTLWAPGAGALEAGLVFRVGMADETLARAGITHLLEHLVLHGVGSSDYHFNGATGRTVTSFVTRGSETDVCSFFAIVCAGLRSVPEGRLEVEKSILRTEASGKSAPVSGPLLTWRYGPVGYGLSAFPELGLTDLSIDDLQAWSARWFVRGNAALWLVGGPPPTGLRLDLPDGPRQPLPEAASALPRLPAYFSQDVNGVALSSVVPRSVAAKTYASVVERRLRSVLRTERGLSYTTASLYEPRDRDYAEITAVADALADRRSELVGPFLDLHTDIATDGCSEEDLSAAHAAATADLSRPGTVVEQLSANAVDLLIGAAPTLSATAVSEIARVTSDDVKRVAREALATGLMMVPRGQAVGRAGFTQAPATSATRVSGREYALVHAPDDRRRLVIAYDGVSLIDGPNAATVHFAEAVALAAYPDGARVLFAPDAITVTIEPTLWNVSAEDLAIVDAHTSPDRIAHLPARSDAEIPQPPPARTEASTADSGSSAAAPKRRDRRRLRRQLGYLGMGLVVAGGATLATLAVVQGKSIMTFLGVGVLATFVMNRIRKHTNT